MLLALAQETTSAASVDKGAVVLAVIGLWVFGILFARKFFVQSRSKWTTESIVFLSGFLSFVVLLTCQFLYKSAPIGSDREVLARSPKSKQWQKMDSLRNLKGENEDATVPYSDEGDTEDYSSFDDKEESYSDEDVYSEEEGGEYDEEEEGEYDEEGNEEVPVPSEQFVEPTLENAEEMVIKKKGFYSIPPSSYSDFEELLDYDLTSCGDKLGVLKKSKDKAEIISNTFEDIFLRLQYTPFFALQGEPRSSTLLPSEVPMTIKVIKDFYLNLKEEQGIVDDSLSHYVDFLSNFYQKQYYQPENPAFKHEYPFPLVIYSKGFNHLAAARYDSANYYFFKSLELGLDSQNIISPIVFSLSKASNSSRLGEFVSLKQEIERRNEKDSLVLALHPPMPAILFLEAGHYFEYLYYSALNQLHYARASSVVFSFLVLLVWLFFWLKVVPVQTLTPGAIVCFLAAGYLSVFVTIYLTDYFEIIGITPKGRVGSVGWSFREFVLFVGPREEFSKVLFVYLIYFAYLRKSNPTPFRILQLAALVGLGFASFENIGYFTVFKGHHIVSIRMLLSVTFHMAMTILCVLPLIFSSRFTQTRLIVYCVLSFLLASLAHGLFDFFLMASAPFLSIMIWFFCIYSISWIINNIINLSSFETVPVGYKTSNSSNLLLSGFFGIISVEFGYFSSQVGVQQANATFGISAFLLLFLMLVASYVLGDMYYTSGQVVSFKPFKRRRAKTYSSSSSYGKLKIEIEFYHPFEEEKIYAVLTNRRDHPNYGSFYDIQTTNRHYNTLGRKWSVHAPEPLVEVRVVYPLNLRMFYLADSNSSTSERLVFSHHISIFHATFP